MGGDTTRYTIYGHTNRALLGVRGLIPPFPAGFVALAGAGGRLEVER